MSHTQNVIAFIERLRDDEAFRNKLEPQLMAIAEGDWDQVVAIAKQEALTTLSQVLHRCEVVDIRRGHFHTRNNTRPRDADMGAEPV